MRMLSLLFAAILSLPAAAEVLDLQKYLDQVKKQNPEAVAQIGLVKAYEKRLDQGESIVMPEFYAGYNMLDDQKPNQNVFMMGDRTQSSQWRFGVRTNTRFGLLGNLYLDTTNTEVRGASPTFMPMNPYRDTRAVLELRQSLWRNSFGDEIRNNVKEARKGAEAQLAQAKFVLQRLMTTAENTYWALASYNEIVKLQEENVARARKLRDYMKGRTRMKLFDDVDFMQTQAGFESRELEYQTSLDERSAVMRTFNTLRGVNGDEVQDLESLATKDWRQDVSKWGSRKVKRGDYTAMRAQAEAVRAHALAARSHLRPELDLVANMTTTGRDTSFSDSVDRAQDFKNPTYYLGVTFSVGLDLGLLFDLCDSYDAEARAAESQVTQADFYETREWHDAIAKKTAAIGLFDRAVSLEKLYGDIVRRERSRLNNGRTTTFQFLKFEQDFAGVQVQRVKSQLALLQLHNALKLFEE
jgi:outer membrane protein TolC